MLFETLTSEARTANLDTIIAFVEELADQVGLENKKKFGLLIAIEEAFINVCNHAYDGEGGECAIACGCDGHDFVVELSDTGAAFDLMSRPEADTTSDLMERQVGGLGIHFIRNLTDEVSYRREAEKNILRMVLHIATEPLQ